MRGKGREGWRTGEGEEERGEDILKRRKSSKYISDSQFKLKATQEEYHSDYTPTYKAL